MRQGLKRIDAAVAAAERVVVVALLAAMAGAVFLDALHRVFAAREGRVEALLVALLPAGAAGAVRAVLAPVVLALVTGAVLYAAIRTRRGGQGRRLQALGEAASLTLLLGGAAQGLVWALPNGLVWSQPLALWFLLWVGLTGASLGAREHAHLAFELAGKLWPPRLRTPAEALARLVAAAFTLFLAVLAIAHAREHYLEWAGSGGEAGVLEAVALPRWVVLAYLPIPFTIMAARFLAYGVRAPEQELAR